MPLLKPTHQPHFSPEQLELARRVAAQQAAPYREVLRARLTLVLAEHPDLSHPEVARRCGLSPKTVEKWRRRWEQQGWSLKDAPRSGRPASFSP
jgi:transposase